MAAVPIRNLAQPVDLEQLGELFEVQQAVRVVKTEMPGHPLPCLSEIGDRRNYFC